MQGAPSLPLAAINDATPEGKQILASARQILGQPGQGDAAAIDLADAADTVKIFASTAFNGDGIIPADAAGDDATRPSSPTSWRAWASRPTAAANPASARPKVDQFFAEAQAHSDWWKQAEGDQTILPLGEATAAAVRRRQGGESEGG